MKRRAALWLVAVAALVAFALPGASAQPTAAGPNAVTKWNRDRDQHARPDSGSCGRSTARPPGQHGDDARRRLRRGQCDRAEAPSAISPREAFLRDRLEGGRRRDRGVPRPLGHRLDGAGEHSVPEPGELLQSLAAQYDDVARGDTGHTVQDPGDRRGERRGRRDDRGTARTTDASGRRSGCRTPDPGHWQPLLPNGTSPLDPTPWVGGVRPFLIESSSQFRTDGPKALTSAA